VHAAAMAASGTRPNNVLAGGGTVDRNDANVMTHPVCVAVWQSGTCWNDPRSGCREKTCRGWGLGASYSPDTA